MFYAAKINVDGEYSTLVLFSASFTRILMKKYCCLFMRHIWTIKGTAYEIQTSASLVSFSKFLTKLLCSIRSTRRIIEKVRFQSKWTYRYQLCGIHNLMTSSDHCYNVLLHFEAPQRLHADKCMPTLSDGNKGCFRLH